MNAVADVVRMDGLTVTLSDGCSLFQEAELRVKGGEFIVLVGPSGSGKTTLLRMIAGMTVPLAGLNVSGRVRVMEESDPRRFRGRVGLVFQDLALFDELSAVDNVRFAADHRAAARGFSAGSGEKQAKQLLQRLQVPVRSSLSQLSGGERQRVAVARTLAMDAPILLFDEPTTGLDAARSRDVVRLLVDTHKQFQKTVIVVTHDYEPFLPFGPRLILLDPKIGRLKDVDEVDLRDYFEQEAPAAAPTATASKPRFGWKSVKRYVERPGQAVMCLLFAFVAPWLGWGRPRWKTRYLWYYLRMVSLGSTFIYVIIAGAMLGFVFVTFSFENIPHAQITLPLLTEEFLAATGYSMYRVVVPLLIAVLMAGKCGASAAADLGARRLTHQFEALDNFGVRPETYFYGNLVLAMGVGVPLLTAIGFLSSCYAAMIAYLMTSPDTTVAMFRQNFFARMWTDANFFPKGTAWVLVKAATTGILIAGLSYDIGSRPKSSSVDVSRDVGRTIFWASLAVLMLHALYSFVEF
ncbi:MAG: ATP-binding cassette domain-containing protein [Planctomycetota bacterium]